jgi:glycosyltransferase involved in cell wall biosynthesis
VVVPTHNRSERVLRLLRALAAQQHAPPFEVVLVDDGSTDGTREIAAEAGRELPFVLRVIRSEQAAGPARARNRGWHEARAELIAFTDDDCVPSTQWLQSIHAGFDSADIVIGRTTPPADQVTEIGPFSSYLDMGHDGRFSTCNIAYRRSILEKLGGFDAETFRYPNGEDTDLGLRAVKAGFRDVYVEQALICHDVHPSNFKSYFRRIPRLDGIVALVALHPDVRPTLNAGFFLRSIDKAVLITWAAGAMVVRRPRRATSWAVAAMGGSLYVWQFGKAYYKPRGRAELLKSLPAAYVADNWTVVVMIRSSIRWRTVLL